MEKLVSLARNPVPHGAVSGQIAAFDGLMLRWARWDAATKSHRGTVCVFGGRTEFIEKYFETIADLRRRGFAVATLDWRGQGGSGRSLRNPRKGHVNDFSEYDADLDVFMEDIVLPDCPPPYFALAHSMGGNILLRAATRRDCWFERMALSAPMLRLKGLPVRQELLGGLAALCVFCGLGDAFVPGGKETGWEAEAFEGNLLTSDRQRFERNREVLAKAPELATGSPTIAWLHAALESMKWIGSDSFPPQVHVPVLMVSAGQDGVVCPRAIELLAARLKAGTQIVIEQSRHEILQERDVIRDRFWAAFDAFIPGGS
ncbi:MAG: alpha/beta hydrolase [Alphaproteobacteria bacterium]|nr:MAG: alpha/beta hydrolase [Alphaproteobacteria bacterium]